MVHVHYTQEPKTVSNKRTDSIRTKGTKSGRRKASAASKSGPVTIYHVDPATLGPIVPYRPARHVDLRPDIKLMAGSTKRQARQQYKHAGSGSLPGHGSMEHELRTLY